MRNKNTTLSQTTIDIEQPSHLEWLCHVQRYIIPIFLWRVVLSFAVVTIVLGSPRRASATEENYHLTAQGAHKNMTRLFGPQASAFLAPAISDSSHLDPTHVIGMRQALHQTLAALDASEIDPMGLYSVLPLGDHHEFTSSHYYRVNPAMHEFSNPEHASKAAFLKMNSRAYDGDGPISPPEIVDGALRAAYFFGKSVLNAALHHRAADIAKEHDHFVHMAPETIEAAIWSPHPTIPLGLGFINGHQNNSLDQARETQDHASTGYWHRLFASTDGNDRFLGTLLQDATLNDPQKLGATLYDALLAEASGDDAHANGSSGCSACSRSELEDSRGYTMTKRVQWILSLLHGFDRWKTFENAPYYSQAHDAVDTPGEDPFPALVLDPNIHSGVVSAHNGILTLSSGAASNTQVEPVIITPADLPLLFSAAAIHSASQSIN